MVRLNDPNEQNECNEHNEQPKPERQVAKVRDVLAFTSREMKEKTIELAAMPEAELQAKLSKYSLETKFLLAEFCRRHDSEYWLLLSLLGPMADATKIALLVSTITLDATINDEVIYRASGTVVRCPISPEEAARLEELHRKQREKEKEEGGEKTDDNS